VPLYACVQTHDPRHIIKKFLPCVLLPTTEFVELVFVYCCGCPIIQSDHSMFHPQLNSDEIEQTLLTSHQTKKNKINTISIRKHFQWHEYPKTVIVNQLETWDDGKLLGQFLYNWNKHDSHLIQGWTIYSRLVQSSFHLHSVVIYHFTRFNVGVSQPDILSAQHWTGGTGGAIPFKLYEITATVP
jgi:hypothetical protein